MYKVRVGGKLWFMMEVWRYSAVKKMWIQYMCPARRRPRLLMSSLLTVYLMWAEGMGKG
jgi:hypothetical protein